MLRAVLIRMALLAAAVLFGTAVGARTSPPATDQRLVNSAQLRATDVPLPWKLTSVKSVLPEPRCGSETASAVSWARFEPLTSNGALDSIVRAYATPLEAGRQLAIFASTAYRACRGKYIASVLHGHVLVNKLYLEGLANGVELNVFVISFTRNGSTYGLDEEDVRGYRGRVLVSVSIFDYDLDRWKGSDERLAKRLFTRILSRLP